MKLLTLIMIVRDESAQLPGFLQHHAPLFDEMIIVDTGSKDQTPKIISDFGAILVSHEWKNDFSAARNAGLEKASGQWMMLLDADERIAQSDFTILRKFLETAPSAVYLQKTINYITGIRHLEWQPVSNVYPHEENGQQGFFAASRAGLFPKGMGLAFSGRVHESILPSAEFSGMDIFSLEIPVHHFGYVLSPQINNERQLRYRKLVGLKIADNPEDWAAMLEMASIHLESAEPDQAIELLLKLVDGPDEHSAVNRGRFLLGRLRREAGELATARQLLKDARKADPSFLFGWLESIRLEAEDNAWSTVSELLLAARNYFPDSEPLLKRENLMLLVKTGQLPEASQVAAELVEKCPQWQEIKPLAEKLAQIQNVGRK